MARLVLLGEGFNGRTYDLKVEKTTVGRVSDNAFEIPEASVSSHHAEIILRGSDVVIRDLDSTNGTFINGQKITEAVLKPGQTLRFGTVDLRLDTGDGPIAAAPSGASAAPKKPKQTLDQTVIIPQGVKMDELGGGDGPPHLGSTTGFEKKSNRGGKIFAIMVIIVIILLLGALGWVLFLS